MCVCMRVCVCVHISLKTCEGSGDKSNVESSHMWDPTLLLQDVDVTVLILCGYRDTHYAPYLVTWQRFVRSTGYILHNIHTMSCKELLR